MKRANLLIVEDEPLIADDIAAILQRKDYVISEIVDNALNAMDYLDGAPVDLVLLDINIEGDRDGIWLAEQINKRYRLPFVFLTSYYDDKTLHRAQQTDPGGYIVKPFDEGDLMANIELALAKKKTRPATEAQKFFVRDRSELKALQPEEILYVESDDNYANLYTPDRKYVVSHTLKSVEEKLTGQGFMRIHKSYLVNFQKITSISEGYAFIGEIKLPIGRSHRKELLKDLLIL